MGKLTREEEVLLSSYSSGGSAKGNALIYINAVIVSLAPIYLFSGIHQMEFGDAYIVWALSAASSIYLLSLAGKNQKRLLKDGIMTKRGPAIDKEINLKYSSDKKMSPKEKDERALYRKNEVADAEATYLSIFFTNIVFVTLLVFFGFFLFANLTPILNLISSVGLSAGLVSFLSTAKN